MILFDAIALAMLGATVGDHERTFLCINRNRDQVAVVRLLFQVSNKRSRSILLRGGLYVAVQLIEGLGCRQLLQ